MNLIKAKFNSRCAETGQAIPKGNNCWHDPVAKKVYALDSKKAEQQYDPAAGTIEAEQEAGFERFTQEDKHYSGYTAYLERDSDNGRDY